MLKQDNPCVLGLTRGRLLVLAVATVVPIMLSAAEGGRIEQNTAKTSGADDADTKTDQKAAAKGLSRHRCVYRLDYTPANDVVNTISDLLNGETRQPDEPQIVVIPDSLTNSILASGSEDELQQIELIIQQIDRATPIVVVDMLIAQATRPADRPHTAEKNAKVGARKRVIELKDLEKLAEDGTIEERFDELNSRGQLLVLSRPHIRTLDKCPAFIKVSSHVASNDSKVAPASKSSRQKGGQDVGVQVGVTPRVTSDGTVLMEVDVDVSQLRMVASTATDKASRGDAAVHPHIVTTSAQSTIRIPNGGTAVLGGLTAESDIPDWQLIIVLTTRVIERQANRR